MDMHQHDSPAVFRVVLRGVLDGEQVPNLEHALDTARSILNGRDLVIDLSGLASADPLGIDLLSRMRDCGAILAAALPPESEGLLQSLGVSVAAPGRPRELTRARRLCRVARRWKILAGSTP
jgi:hypothetical protein